MAFRLSTLLGIRHANLGSLFFCSSTSKYPHIQSLVDSNKVYLFMKGSPEEPRCGFSNAVVQVLRMHGLEASSGSYSSSDVLEDNDLRQEVKDFSNWPTIPQLYINGQLVGGCDIVLDMHRSGDLIEELEKAGIRSALLDKEEPKASS